MKAMTDPGQDLDRRLAETRFRRLYAEHGREVLAYALRRTADAEDAADILAETFLVAWRRAGEVPAGGEARLWLYGVARRALANQRRGERRRDRLTQRLRSELAAAIPSDSMPAREDDRVRAALARLHPDDREVLRLTAWEGLSPSEAACALGVSAVAARSRLHRARRRFRQELAGPRVNRPAKTDLRIEEGR
jgi:RNA polymerase sigma factor (sigma-70 family)